MKSKRKEKTEAAEQKTVPIIPVKHGVKITMECVSDYFSEYRLEDLCISCRCINLIRKMNGGGRMVIACGKWHDNSQCIKQCNDYETILDKNETEQFEKEKERLNNDKN